MDVVDPPVINGRFDINRIDGNQRSPLASRQDIGRCGVNILHLLIVFSWCSVGKLEHERLLLCSLVGGGRGGSGRAGQNTQKQTEETAERCRVYGRDDGDGSMCSFIRHPAIRFVPVPFPSPLSVSSCSCLRLPPSATPRLRTPDTGVVFFFFCRSRSFPKHNSLIFLDLKLSFNDMFSRTLLVAFLTISLSSFTAQAAPARQQPASCDVRSLFLVIYRISYRFTNIRLRLSVPLSRLSL